MPLAKCSASAASSADQLCRVAVCCMVGGYSELEGNLRGFVAKRSWFASAGVHCLALLSVVVIHGSQPHFQAACEGIERYPLSLWSLLPNWFGMMRMKRGAGERGHESREINMQLFL